MDATYDPDDNKLRLRTCGRLDADDYARAKACGFRWAPKQELFYAPWSPAGEDLLREWCGEIEDEDTSLVDRAADRAERFEGYSANRERDGDRAHRAVSALTDGIPLGQPILVGHHSEKRARKDAERIQNGMDRAVKMWKTAEYWERRASSLVGHAEYKGTPAVRARRIKTLEAEQRKRVASYTPHGPEFLQEPRNDCWREEHHPRGETCERCEPCPHVLAGSKGRGAWPVRVDRLPAIERSQARWVAHLEQRLTYERALLAEQGASGLLKPKARPKRPPILNYRADDGIDVRNIYSGAVERMGQRDMTKAEWKKLWADYKGTRTTGDGSHRVRTAMVRDGRGSHTLALVFLTDSKAHARPEVVA